MHLASFRKRGFWNSQINGLLPILRLDRLSKCWVELHYGTVFWGEGGAKTVPWCISTLPWPSVTFNLKIAYINCGGEGWKGPGGRVKILKMWINVNKSALRFSIDRKHFWTANFSKTRTITWLLSIYKRQTEDITSIFGINWRIKMTFCNLSLRLPSLSSKERKVPPVLQTH